MKSKIQPLALPPLDFFEAAVDKLGLLGALKVCSNLNNGSVALLCPNAKVLALLKVKCEIY